MMSTIKIKPIAKIDGAQFIRAMKIAALQTAEIGVVFEVDMGNDTKFSCDSTEDVVAILKAIQTNSAPADGDGK